MPDSCHPFTLDPTSLMAPDVDRLIAFADGLAAEGEEGLSTLVRIVADGLGEVLTPATESAE